MNCYSRIEWVLGDLTLQFGGQITQELLKNCDSMMLSEM